MKYIRHNRPMTMLVARRRFIDVSHASPLAGILVRRSDGSERATLSSRAYLSAKRCPPIEAGNGVPRAPMASASTSGARLIRELFHRARKTATCERDARQLQSHLAACQGAHQS